MQPNPEPQAQVEEPSRRALNRLLANMPADIAHSFSDRQLEGLQAALVASTRKRHPIDLRWSIPVLMRRFYLVLLVGEEERSKARRQQP
jgi:hypothetical protein